MKPFHALPFLYSQSPGPRVDIRHKSYFRCPNVTASEDVLC